MPGSRVPDRRTTLPTDPHARTTLPADPPWPVQVSKKINRSYLRYLDARIAAVRGAPDFEATRRACAPCREGIQEQEQSARSRGDLDHDPHVYYAAAVSRLAAVEPGPPAFGLASYDRGQNLYMTDEPPEHLHHDIDSLLISAGLATAASVRFTFHLRLLCAHLLLSPVDIYKARFVPEPFPFPWCVLRRGVDGPRHLRLDPEYPLDVEPVIGRVHRDLQASHRIAPQAPHGSSAEAQQWRQDKDALRHAAAKTAYELKVGGKSYANILNDETFQKALRRITNKDGRTRTRTITSEHGVRKLVGEYQRAQGLPPPSRARRSRS